MSSEWKNWDIENGDDYFIHRDLPDVWQLLQEELAKVAPVIWDERIKDYFDQVNIYTSNEIYESVNGWWFFTRKFWVHDVMLGLFTMVLFALVEGHFMIAISQTILNRN